MFARKLARALVGLVVVLAVVVGGSASAVPPMQSAPTAESAMIAHADHGMHRSLTTHTVAEPGPPSVTYDPNATRAVGHESHGTWARPSGTTTGATYDYDGTTLSALIDNFAGTTRYPAQVTSGDLSPLPRSQVATKSGTELRKVGSVLESVDDVMANPSLLAGRQPAVVENLLKNTPGRQAEKLARGSQTGRGWVFRQYTPAGNPTGQQLRWHPGGGHHGPDSYWRVVGPNGDLGGIIR